MAQPKILGNQIDQSTLTNSGAAITPASVAASGTVTGSNLSGTNTGDQTITLTGDVTGSGTGSFAATLATVNSNVGSFTNANVTVNAKGLITAASNGSGGGASFPIGTIVQGPTAPTGAGTWLECNGQSVSQTTYADLYSAIGHNYLSYTFARKAAFTSANRTTSKIVWNGTKWLAFNSASTTVYQSTNNGDTWSSTGVALPGSVTSPTVQTNPSTGTVFVSGSTTTMYKSTDSGATWSTVTLPASTVASSIWGFNGNNIVASIGSTTLYTSADDGTTWSTNSSTWPNSIRADELIWDGSKWVGISLVAGSSGSVAAYYTSTSTTGTSGWSVSYPNTIPGGSSSVSFIIKPASSTIISAAPNALYLSTDATSTSNIIGTNLSNNTTLYGYNGKHFFVSTANAPRYTIISNQGFICENYFTLPSDTNFGGSLAWGPSWIGSGIKFSTNFSTYSFMSLFAQARGSTGAATDVQIAYISPTINTSTNFNVPKLSFVSFTAQTKSWIKAL